MDIKKLFNNLFVGFPTPSGIDWRLNIPDIPAVIPLYQFKRPRRHLRQRRIRQSHCRIVGGNHRQNDKRGFRRWQRNQE